jgi:shikimate 5-dehydrogenase
MGSHQKVAVITGAGTGVGKATALALLKEGYRVVLVGRRAELLEKTAAESGAGVRVLAVPADISNPESVRMLFQKHSGASICCSTTPASMRPESRSRISPMNIGNRLWRRTSRACFSARRRRSGS